MQDKELYHIHLKNNQDKKWVVGNTINVDKNFNSIMYQRQMNFSQIIQLSNGMDKSYQNYSIVIANYFNRIKDLKSIRNEDLEELKNLLNIGYQMSFNADFFKRETALEDCRKSYNDALPSRLHSIYLCDYDGLNYWKDCLSNSNKKEFDVFEVNVTGNIFKTNEQLLPNEVSTYEETYKNAIKYWNPKLKDCPANTYEYLVEGKVKILSKI